MAYPNGRLPTASLTRLETSWSNRGRTEYLDARAAASLARVLIRAVARSGANFQLYDAYRSYDEQVSILKDYYYPVPGGRRDGDRSLDGQTYRRRSGKPSAASPGHSKHGTGMAVDLHPGPIQRWLRNYGRAYGWSWDEGRKVGEAWHFVYVPSLDRHRKEGTPDVRLVQRVLGVTVDGKYGVGTAEAVRTWQGEHGIAVDGIAGPRTIAAMAAEEKGGDAKAAAAVVDVEPAEVPNETSAGYVYDFTREQWDTQPVGQEVHEFDHQVEGVYLHHPAYAGALADASADEVKALLRKWRHQHTVAQGWFDIGYSAAVDMAGRRYELRGLGMESGANGGSASNDVAPAILLIVGEGETPSPAMVAGVLDLLAQVKRAHPTAAWVRGHRDSPDASTACPGPIIAAQIADGVYHLDGSTSATPTPAVPEAAAPTGKAALMALFDAPDFPLLRTDAHRCYYGGDAKLEAVSGKMPNSLAPGEISGSGLKSSAAGLKTWQRQMNKRGYDLKVDGRYGDNVEKAAKNLQRLAGLTVDGKIGPDAWYAAFLLPVQR